MKILAMLLILPLTVLAKDDKVRTFQQPLEAVWVACLKVAGEQHIVENTEKEAGLITFRSGKSAASNGFKVSVSITKVDDGVRVKVNTQKTGLQLIAWGAGGRLTKKYFGAVEKELKKP